MEHRTGALAPRRQLKAAQPSCHTPSIRCCQLDEEGDVIIDCEGCVMNGTRTCSQCVVPLLLSVAPGPLQLSEHEADALDHLAEAGLVPPLRLMRREEDDDAATG